MIEIFGFQATGGEIMSSLLGTAHRLEIMEIKFVGNRKLADGLNE